MAVTILGEHINMIRRVVPPQPRIYKDEMPRIKHHSRSKTIKKHTGKVVSISVKLKSGGIRGIMNLSKTHEDVVNFFDIIPSFIIAYGWGLDNGNYVWRDRPFKF